MDVPFCPWHLGQLPYPKVSLPSHLPVFDVASREVAFLRWMFHTPYLHCDRTLRLVFVKPCALLNAPMWLT